jgi:hypothetical protein
MTRNLKTAGFRLAAPLFAASTLLLLPGSAPAQSRRQDEGYLRAMADLRYARSLLDVDSYPDVTPQTRKAVREIDVAMSDFQQAAVDDHKSLDDHPPVDSARKPHERFQDAIAALKRAHADAAAEPDSPRHPGLRVRALHDIDAAEINAEQAYARAAADYSRKH